MKPLLLLASLLSLAASAADEAAGWKPLFDGTSLIGWTTKAGKPVTDGWEVVDGAIHRSGAGGDIVSREEFFNFELEFEWKVAAGANSGLKYRVGEYLPAGKNIGLEYQLLDDAGHDNGKTPKTSAGSLYDLVAPTAAKHLKPVGEWNRSRVVARGGLLEHWLNGEKVVAVNLAGPEWKAALEKSKFRTAADFGTRKGRILLQDHGDEAWFRALRIRPLPDA